MSQKVNKQITVAMMPSEASMIYTALSDLRDKMTKQTYPTSKLHKSAWAEIKNLDALRTRIYTSKNQA